MKNIILIALSLFIFSVGAYAQDAAAPVDEKPWKAEAEAGIVSSNGNTRSSSYLIKNITSYKFDAYLAKLNGSYLSNESRDNATNTTTSYEKWDVGLRIERDLSEKLGIFLGQNIESDKKAGIDRRFNSDLGAKYYVAKKEDYYTFTELGYRYTTEEYITGVDKNFDFIRAYIESEKKWTPTFSSKLWVEYLPNLDETDDYNVNGEASINASLDSTFSIKTAYLVKYDNMPAAAHKTDSLFSTALIAKF
ncbi:MAG: DUF481 domain-containing protein [Bdellovibrionota bacterium]